MLFGFEILIACTFCRLGSIPESMRRFRYNDALNSTFGLRYFSLLMRLFCCAD